MLCAVLRTTGRAVATLVVLTGLATGCTGGSSERGSAATPATSSAATSAVPSPSPTPVVVPPAPRRAACYRLSFAQLTRPSDDSRPVSCVGRHTSRTILVGTLDTDADGHSLAVDSAAVQRQLSTTCPRRLAGYLGGSRQTRELARFDVVWFSPTLDQSDRGAGWFRCDLVAFSRDERLLDLPTTAGGSLAGVLDRPGALDTFGLCGTAAPGAAGFARVACGQRHAWRAFETIGLGTGRAYPGAAAVRDAGDDRCKDAARARADDTLKFRYGWEWPTRQQWRAGQRYGYCWVPTTS